MSGSSFRMKERVMKARTKGGKEGRKSELDERRAKRVESKNKNIRERSFYDSLFVERESWHLERSQEHSSTQADVTLE